MVRILMIGDVVGKPGRRALSTLVPDLRRRLSLDLVIANGENAAGGRGLTLDTAQEILDAGVDVITSGNHIWDQKEIIPYLDGDLPIVRPANYPRGLPGKGHLISHDILVLNLIGRTFMQPYDCPFREADRLLAELPQRPNVVFVDFHAEATSEKQALGWYLDGRVSAVVGTHTHVGTADTRILPQGTAYCTDVGMTGPVNSVIGDVVEAVIARFLTQMPNRLPVASGPVLMNAVMIEVDERTGRAQSIVRIDQQTE